jgi:hypothetical protein
MSRRALHRIRRRLNVATTFIPNSQELTITLRKFLNTFLKLGSMQFHVIHLLKGRARERFKDFLIENHDAVVVFAPEVKHLKLRNPSSPSEKTCAGVEFIKLPPQNNERILDYLFGILP